MRSTIRTRLVLLLLVPLLGLLAVAGWAVRDATQRAERANAAVELAGRAEGASEVVRALQRERAATAQVAAGRIGPR